MRLLRALRSACPTLEVEQLVPPCRQGVPGWQVELLELYDGDSFQRLEVFLRSVRWGDSDSSWPVLSQLVDLPDEETRRAASSRNASRIVFALNYFGVEFEQCFRLFLLQEVALKVDTKLLRSEAWVKLWDSRASIAVSPHLGVASISASRFL